MALIMSFLEEDYHNDEQCRVKKDSLFILIQLRFSSHSDFLIEKYSELSP